MVLLFRPPSDAPGGAVADAVEAVLQDASAAYESARHEGPPFVLDGSQRIAGTQALLAWAETYATEARNWRFFSGDYCLLDD